MQEKYGAMVGTSNTSGKALEQMLREDQMANLAAQQWGAQQLQSASQIPSNVSNQQATIAPQVGAPYPSTQNISNYLGFTQYPQSQTVSDVTKLLPAYQAYPNATAQGFGAAYQPSSTTQQVNQYKDVPTGNNTWLYTGLSDAIGQISKSLATDTAKTNAMTGTKS
jgi:hypothetical protein